MFLKRKTALAEVVHLVRHAEPPREWRGRYLGSGDILPDPAGLAMCSRIPGLLGGGSVIIASSPLKRALKTAEAVAGALGAPVEVDAALREIDFGAYEGLTFAEVALSDPEGAERWKRDPGRFVFPGGEGVEEFERRARGAWERWSGSGAEKILVVSHGGVISSWCCFFLGLPFSRRMAFKPEYCRLTTFARSSPDRSWLLEALNR